MMRRHRIVSTSLYPIHLLLPDMLHLLKSLESTMKPSLALSNRILFKVNTYNVSVKKVFINMSAATKLFDILDQIWVDIGQKRMRFRIVFFLLLNSLENVAL